jgi:serine/threonine protein kinase
MMTNRACPLERVSCCREVPEYHDAQEFGDAPLRQGQLLDDRFRIIEVLSRSGMGTIFKGEDIRNDNLPVAIKVPYSQYESDPNFFSRFSNEERIGLELDHPFILKVVPCEQKSRPYIVTEYVKGCTLEHLLKAMKPLPEKDALKLASLICEGLQYMHDHGIIHRDIKPQNVMICCDGTIRILDFGIARAAGSPRLTRGEDTSSMGTPDYMAPEQVKGKRSDKRTDIYNLGAVLYEMLTGATPFQDENPWAALNARVDRDPTAPRKLNDELSAQVEEIVLRALQRDPADRYQSAADMKSELDAAEHVRVTGLANRAQGPSRRNPFFLKRPWVLATALLAPLAIGIIVISLLLFRLQAAAP